MKYETSTRPSETRQKQRLESFGKALSRLKEVFGIETLHELK